MEEIEKLMKIINKTNEKNVGKIYAYEFVFCRIFWNVKKYREK